MNGIIEKIMQKEKIAYNNIKKSASGFTNLVYFIDDKYVIKIINIGTKPEKLQKEIAFYQNVNLDFIPKFIASGSIEEIDYLIIEKLGGESLYKVWHRLNDLERKSVIKQISEILNIFHKQGYLWLKEKFVNLNWKEKWQKSFELNIDILKKKGFNTTNLENFRNSKSNEIFEEQRLALVYNDAHFDNFIYDKGVIKLIDFDRVLYCSVDYELLIIKQMLDNPRKFASEEDEINVKKTDYITIWEELKKHHTQMFDFKHINERVFIYQFINSLGQAYEYKHDELIAKALEEFDAYFYPHKN